MARQPTITRHIGIEDGSKLSRQTIFHAGVPFFEFGRFRNTIARSCGWRANEGNWPQAVIYMSPPHLASHLYREIMCQCRWGSFLSVFLQLIRIRFIALWYSFFRAKECMF